MLRHLQDRVHRFLLGVSMNEQVFTTMMSASSARGVISAPPWDEQPHHDLAVHQVLGTAQADEANFLGSKWSRAASSGGFRTGLQNRLSRAWNPFILASFAGLHRRLRGTRSARARAATGNGMMQ